MLCCRSNCCWLLRRVSPSVNFLLFLPLRSVVHSFLENLSKKLVEEVLKFYDLLARRRLEGKLNRERDSQETEPKGLLDGDRLLEAGHPTVQHRHLGSNLSRMLARSLFVLVSWLLPLMVICCNSSQVLTVSVMWRRRQTVTFLDRDTKGLIDLKGSSSSLVTTERTVMKRLLNKHGVCKWLLTIKIRVTYSVVSEVILRSVSWPVVNKIYLSFLRTWKRNLDRLPQQF